jgi:hypothetical protein
VSVLCVVVCGGSDRVFANVLGRRLLKHCDVAILCVGGRFSLVGDLVVSSLVDGYDDVVFVGFDKDIENFQRFRGVKLVFDSSLRNTNIDLCLPFASKRKKTLLSLRTYLEVASVLDFSVLDRDPTVDFDYSGKSSFISL